MRALRLIGCLLLMLALAACSDDDTPGSDGGLDSGGEGGIGNDVTPAKFVGGGTGGGAIDGRLNVYVLDAVDDKPLEGALVMLDDGSTDKGTTDKEGLVTFRRAGLKGPVTMTMGLTGYSTGTVVGLNAANITLNLDSRTTAPPVDTGKVTGTIKDWDKLPPLVTNHFRIGFAGYLYDEDMGSARNKVAQPAGDLNTYNPDPPLNKTSWELTVPAGDNVGVYVIVIDVDTKGTSADTDDTTEVTHIGLVQDLKVAASQTVQNVDVPINKFDDKLKVKLPAQPAGADQVAVGVLIQLASKALLPIFYAGATQTEYPVPKLSGEFAGGNYWVILAAEPKGEQEDNRQTETLIFKRGLTDTTQTVEGTLLDLPSNLKLEGRKISFTVPSGTHFQGAKLFPEGKGESYWGITFVGQSATDLSYTLPAIPSGAKVEPLPPGKLFLHVNAMDLPGVDFNDIKFTELIDFVARTTQRGLSVELK